MRVSFQYALCLGHTVCGTALTDHCTLELLVVQWDVDRSVFRVRLICLRTVGVGLSSVPPHCLSSVEAWSLACGVDVGCGMGDF